MSTRSPTRILYTIPNLDSAGSGKALLHLVRHLDRNRFDPTIAVSRQADTATARAFETIDVPVIEAAVTLDPHPRGSLPIRAFRRGRELRSLGASIWHSFHYLDDYTEPLVARAAGARWIYQKKNMSWNGRSWRLRTALAHAVAAQNTDMLRQFFPGRWGRRVHLVPPGVEVPDRAELTPPRVVRRRHRLPDDAPLVTCVARVQPLKRQPVLVEAMAHVPRAHLVLAGDGDDGSTTAVDAAAEEYGLADRTHRIGFIDDVNGLIGASTVVCLPTGPVGEGCPVALLEAMALGAAVVATDIPGSRDVVHHRTDGLLVPADDTEALGQAIRGLLEDDELRERLGRAARRRIAQRYTIDIEAERHQRIYDDLLRRR